MKTEYTHFSGLLRAYEFACMTGQRDGAINDLATACARSVIKKCIDPQRKSATEKESASNAGHNPAMVAIRNSINADVAALADLAEAQEKARRIRINRNGKAVSDVVDKSADDAIDAIIAECLGDGIDLVQEAAVAIVEQTNRAFPHAVVVDGISPACFGWMEKPYEIRRIKKRVIIKDTDTVQWEVVETNPISEVYKAVRRSVATSRAVQADPKNGYIYIDSFADDVDDGATERTQDTIYYRLNKYADLGGRATSGRFDRSGNYAHDGFYTADIQTMHDYNDIVASLNLTERQTQIVMLRMRGYGYKAIASYLGVSNRAIINACEKMQCKCEKLGFTPAEALADRLESESAAIARRENVRSVVELLAIAEATATDNAFFIAWDEADKYRLTMRDIEEEKKRIAWEIGCKLRNAEKVADQATAEKLYKSAFDMAERFGVGSKYLAHFGRHAVEI